MQNELTKLGSSLRNGSTDGTAAVKPLDAMIQRLHTLKRKMESLHEEEQVLHEASRRRLSHLNDLYEMNSLADVKYDEWSAVRLDRLLVEYMVRQGYSESAWALTREKGIEELVDLGVFDRCERVRRSLRWGSLDECLAWCAEYKVVMKKTDTSLEFELRLQQYIELCRQDRFVEARDHAKKYFPQYHEGHQEKISIAASLLAFKPDRRQHVCTMLGPLPKNKFSADLSAIDVVFPIQMGRAGRPFYRYTPSALLPALTASPPHRPFRRSLRSQDSILPLEACQQHRECQLHHHFGMSHLLDRIEWARPKATVCPSHQELRRERPCRPRAWERREGIWTRSTAGVLQEDRPRGRFREGSYLVAHLAGERVEEGVHLLNLPIAPAWW